ncbi:hypothetical protein Bca52824_020046 [Brassica carinata]|uniref:Adenylyl-sulfate kinase n=1 Tax=Brassica carinata TaxID=52824 RepID=A0A8X7VSX9_BRACI|nr:hypothetical protein Bca52824_020046 [Brassica carinata]
MDAAAVARCVVRCYVSPTFGDSESLRSLERKHLKITLHDSRSSDNVGSSGLKFRGKNEKKQTNGTQKNIVWHACPITKPDRQELIKQNVTSRIVIWKSSLACALSRALYNRGKLSYILDGDNVRHRLNSDLSFKAEDRAENVRRVGEVSKLFADAGIICIASLISPYRKERAACRALLPEGDFIEVFMDVPLHVCEARDPKGLYKRARAGEIKGFTGIDDPYEPPLNCEIVMQNSRDNDFSSSSSLPEMAEIVVS